MSRRASQLWNIFTGDISIVVSRPFKKVTRDYIRVEILEDIQDFQPGLSGTGAIIFRDEETIIHKSEKGYHEVYQRVTAKLEEKAELWYKKSFIFHRSENHFVDRLGGYFVR